MDPNNPTAPNSEVLNQNPTSNVSKATNKTLTILLSVLVLILLISTGYLYYQNMQLQKQITSLQTTAITSAQPTVQAEVPSATPDPTVNWKTYNDSKKSLLFKYPENYFVNETTLDDNTSIIFVDSKKIVIPETWNSNLAPIEIRYNPNIKSVTEIVDLAKTQVTPASLSNKQSLVSGVNLYTITGKLVEGYMGGENYYEAIFDARKGVVKLNYWDYFKDGIPINIVENIISTFKFTK